MGRCCLSVTSEPSRSGRETPWETGRFDARRGGRKLLFGRMYEDAAIEERAFPPGGRIFCIASAGCTAMRLAASRDVVAVDVNPLQLAYVERRLAGRPPVHGVAEHVLACGRVFARLAGWRPSRLHAFLQLDDPSEQLVFWRRHLHTRMFRAAFEGLLSRTVLRAVYASPLLQCLPRRPGGVLRGRMERCFAKHPNRTNPYARALLLGELPDELPPKDASRIRLVRADAADYLEHERAASFDGLTLSNILDGVDPAYEGRLLSAVRRAAAPGAKVVLRSFREAVAASPTNHAVEDRAILWGLVDVRLASSL